MNNLELILEELASTNKITVYHSSGNPNLMSVLKKDDFNPGIHGAGKNYGAGFYSVWKKEDLANYGDYYYKGYVNFKENNILILDPKFYQEIYKKNPQKNFIKKQLSKNHIKYPEDEGEPPVFEIKNGKEYFGGSLYSKAGAYQSTQAIGIMEYYFHNLNSIFDGVAYYTESDGHCLLMWNYHAVKIFAKYSKEDKKTTKLDSKALTSQKKVIFKNESLYKSGTIKIVERDKKYLFFDGKVLKASFSREQKDVNTRTIRDFNNLKTFIEQNKIPKYVINSLIFTDGKGIYNRERVKRTAIRRRGKFTPKPTDKVIEDDINSGEVLKMIRSEMKKRFFRRNSYLDLLEKKLLKDKSSIDKVLSWLSKRKLTIRDFGHLTRRIDFSKNIIFDCDNSKNPFPNYFSKDWNNVSNLTFQGKFINVNKNETHVGVKCSLVMFSKNGIFEVPKAFSTLYVDNVESSGEKEAFNSIRKFVGNVVFDNPPMDFFRSETFPESTFSSSLDFDDMPASPLRTSLFNRRKMGEIISIERAKNITFGKEKNSWVFPKYVKEIHFSAKLESSSLAELRRRNPTIKFIKEN